MLERLIKALDHVVDLDPFYLVFFGVEVPCSLSKLLKLPPKDHVRRDSNLGWEAQTLLLCFAPRNI